MSFATTLIDDSNKDIFLIPLSEEAKEEADLFLGLYEEESDMACGVLAATTLKDEDDKMVLSVRELILDEKFKGPEAMTELIRGLQDVAIAADCSAVYHSEYIPEGDEEGKADFFAGLGFYEEEKKLPLYEFKPSAIKAKTPQTDMECIPLSELTKKQWNQFKKETADYGFGLSDMTYYDQDMSCFLVDQNDNVQAGLLSTVRDGDLYLEAIAAYGPDEMALLNDMAFWLFGNIRTVLSPKATIYMYLFSEKMQAKLLFAFTGGKADKVGNLVNFTYEVPI